MKTCQCKEEVINVLVYENGEAYCEDCGGLIYKEHIEKDDDKTS